MRRIKKTFNSDIFSFTISAYIDGRHPGSTIGFETEPIR